MANLHLISQAISPDSLKSAFSRYVSTQEPLLFIGESVASLLEQGVAEFLKQENIPSYALVADCQLRGIASQIPSFISQINDAQMVNLIANAKQTISW
ncbi:DsrH/TusB family sulfur metabolism protein [Aliikangiella coralliicola]|uniref:Sulfurtransferase complex subunit TusB n=1 Tax=Aliikangiella coralliicola TaxID=2592383 RepID=A0A545UAK4_9GAMM|nr:DsrH/TusB family sulfur metabolism protein [Aliikangiella coralliicola]TQV86500.1 hypothetical protein FLL46_16445 [Aliikangiella coralliicola]